MNGSLYVGDFIFVFVVQRLSVHQGRVHHVYMCEKVNLERESIETKYETRRLEFTPAVPERRIRVIFYYFM